MSKMMSDNELQQVERLVSIAGFVIFTVTRYVSQMDVRFHTCLETIRQCDDRRIPIVVVDSSPDAFVRKRLQEAGALVYEQTYRGKKGAALREAATIASQLPGVTPDTMLCWQEPEKTDMVRLWDEKLEPPDREQEEDVMIMYRSVHDFRDSYPKEQYHSEMYGNHYLDAVAQEEMKKLGLEYIPEVNDLGIEEDMMEFQSAKVDWHFGPFCFKNKHVNLWTKYRDGDSYDAQLVPLVHAMRKGLNVTSRHVAYQAPLEMKEQEEGNIAFIEKRLAQLNELDPRVKRAWKDEFYC